MSPSRGVVHIIWHEAATTWDMLRSWTSIDIRKLTGSRMNDPENAILMNQNEHLWFGQFEFILTKTR